MSGPIVRKYGFPNFDQIFGKRELQHGVEEGDESAPAPETADAATAAPSKKAPAKPKAKAKKSS